MYLIHFNDTVDFTDEPEAGKEADGSGEKEEEEHHDQGVSEV